MAATITTEIVPAWAVEEGDVLRDAEGVQFSVARVDADVAANGGFVAIYWMEGLEGRILFGPDQQIERVASGATGREAIADWARALLA